MGTPDFAVPCLNRLVQEHHQVAAVVTQPDRPRGRGRLVFPSPVKQTALKLGLPVLQPESVKDKEFLPVLQQLHPEVIVAVAFGQILPPAILQLPPLGCINVHASLLPRYRGAAPIHWAVMNGETETGITTMFMAAGMDTGDIILQFRTAIGAKETTGDVHDRLAVLGARALAETMSLLAEGRVPRQAQDEHKATYAPLLRREHERLNWSRSTQQLYNQIRGLNPWPGAYTIHRGQVLKCWGAERVAAPQIAGKVTPGLVTALDKRGISIGTGDGIILLTCVQPANKGRMSAADFSHGYALQVGDILE